MIRHGFVIFLFCGLACALATPALAQDDMPKGPLPDAAAAIAVAHLFLSHLDAATGIVTPEPLSATRDGNIWVVESPHKCADTANSACNSEVMLRISATTGAVGYIRHPLQKSTE
jgi:hypothetical protein